MHWCFNSSVVILIPCICFQQNRLLHIDSPSSKHLCSSKHWLVSASGLNQSQVNFFFPSLLLLLILHWAVSSSSSSQVIFFFSLKSIFSFFYFCTFFLLREWLANSICLFFLLLLFFPSPFIWHRMQFAECCFSSDFES